MTTPSVEPPQYPNAPVTSVALDVRFPGPSAGRSIGERMQRDLRDRLGEDDWVVQVLQQAEITFAARSSGAAPEPFRTVDLPLFVRRTQFTALSIESGGLTLETTQFDDYTAFRDLAELVLAAVANVVEPQGILRLGLRYIDELRRLTDSPRVPRQWAEWVDASLVGPKVAEMEDLGYRARHWRGEVFFETGEDRSLILRYEPRPGPIAYPFGPLLRPRPPDPGPWFLLDFDAAWVPKEIPPFDVARLLEECDGLKQSMYALFELLTTDELRGVFNKPGG